MGAIIQYLQCSLMSFSVLPMNLSCFCEMKVILLRYNSCPQVQIFLTLFFSISTLTAILLEAVFKLLLD